MSGVYLPIIKAIVICEIDSRKIAKDKIKWKMETLFGNKLRIMSKKKVEKIIERERWIKWRVKKKKEGKKNNCYDV